MNIPRLSADEIRDFMQEANDRTYRAGLLDELVEILVSQGRDADADLTKAEAARLRREAALIIQWAVPPVVTGAA